MSFQQQLEIQDESLLPEDSRSILSKRKLSKPKAFVRSIDYPKFSFKATCTGVPQDIYVGQRLEFCVKIDPQLPPGTSFVEPEVSLDSCNVTLIAQTGGSQPTHIEVLQQRHRSQRPSGPFQKDNGYTKIVDLGILGHVPSTFNFADVSQSHKLRLEIQFHAANNTVQMKRECPVVFHAGGGAQLLQDDGLPTYEEVMRTSQESQRR